MSNNDSNKSDNGLAALLLIASLGYAAYKTLTTSSNPSKKILSSFMVDDIVNRFFRSFDEFDMGSLALYYVLPDFFMGSFKDEIYHDIMFKRINLIYHRLSLFKGDYEGYYPTLSESDINNLICFIKTDCYEEIKYTKFFASLKGIFIGKLPGLGAVGTATKAKMEYHILQSITKGLSVYFCDLFVYGCSIDDAKKHLLNVYVNCFFDSAF